MSELIKKSLENIAKASQEKLILELVDFYKPYFSSEEETKSFVLACETHKEPSFKRALHQLQRHMNLANEMENIQKGKDTFQVFFWIVAIEAIFKASTEYSKKQKVEIVRDFFKLYISQENQSTLISSIRKNEDPVEHTTIEMVADMFNTVRNMFAHEGIYWMFTFPAKRGECTINYLPKERTSFFSTYTMGPENMDAYSLSITKKEVQDIIIKGAIFFIQDTLQKYSK